MTVAAAGASSDISSAAMAEVPIAKEIGTPESRSAANTRPRMMASFISVQAGGLVRHLGLAAHGFDQEHDRVKGDEHPCERHREIHVPKFQLQRRRLLA